MDPLWSREGALDKPAVFIACTSVTSCGCPDEEHLRLVSGAELSHPRDEEGEQDVGEVARDVGVGEEVLSGGVAGKG